MPVLRELDAAFVRYETRNEEVEVIVGDHETWAERGRPTERVMRDVEYQHIVETLAEAQGIQFRCPLHNHYHAIAFADRGVLDHQGSHGEGGEPTRWQITSSSTGLDDLTLTPSIHAKSNACGWHGYITNGNAT